MSDVLLDEVESLEAILMDDVIVRRNEASGLPEEIETTVFPTVGGDVGRQFICITLHVHPTAGYPDESPRFVLRNSRGLDDHRIDRIHRAVVQKLADSIGNPIVFDLIDLIREHLTEQNLPSGQCVVCLYGFHEGDEFSKTICYHYFHSFCLARHLAASQKNYQEEQDKLPTWQRRMAKAYQPLCPVCREPISDDTANLLAAPQPAELENAPSFALTDELKSLQSRMAALFLRQKQRGAIIDLNAEDNSVIFLDASPETTDSAKLPTEDGTGVAGTVEHRPARTASPMGRGGSNFRTVNRGLNRNQHQHNCNRPKSHGASSQHGSPTATVASAPATHCDEPPQSAEREHSKNMPRAYGRRLNRMRSGHHNRHSGNGRHDHRDGDHYAQADAHCARSDHTR